MEEVVNTIGELELEILSHAWVESIHCSEYLEFEQIPNEYVSSVLQTIYIVDVLQNIIDAVDSWMSDETDEDKSWAILSHRISYRKLLAVLGYYINEGSKDIMNEDKRTEALLSARVYFKMLSIPGFMAYEIYHSQLFSHSLACIGFPKIICDKFDEKSKDKDRSRSNRHARMQEHRNQVNSLIKQLQLFVGDLRAIVEQLQLGPNDLNFEDILNNLVEVTGGAIVNKIPNVDRIELTQLTQVVYEVIHMLVCDADNRPIPMALNQLFKCLHGKLVAACSDPRSSNSSIRASYVSYSGVVLSQYGKEALKNFHILLEHLCYTAEDLERADTRSTRVDMVAGLMSFLPPRIHNKLVKWIIELSKTSRVSHRHLAVDLLEKMLSYGDREDNSTDTDKNAKLKPLETANKKSSGDQQSNGEIQRSGDNETTAMDTDESPEEAANATHNEPEVTEEELQSILQERTITVPYGEILRALYERVQDVSSTVRTRAVVVLIKCLDNKSPAMRQALTDMHGEGQVSRLMAVAARCVCDERAVVRRTGVALVLRLLETQDAPPAAIDLGILVSLCRDASIIVRTAAIQALADLVIKHTSMAVIDSFLSGPMHQLSDPETKVQDTVKSLVKKLLIDRLKRYSVGDEDPIPWMFLASITKHNMRRHLQKACSQLATPPNNCISVMLVDILSTHLNALNCTRDLQTLVMLTSVARHVEYSDINFVLQYYYQLANAQQYQSEESDSRLMPLTLELISLWSRFARFEQRTALRDHLVRRLAASSDDGCRIACAFLASQLDSSNLSWATELMQLAERAALNNGDVEEWLRAADLSLVAPTPPSSKLVQLFLKAIKNLPADWSGRRAGECVAGVGRLSVRSRSVAAAAAPAAAKLLHSDVPLQARVNALLVLSDICIRYANIIEPLLDSVCGCLEQRAPQELRRHAARAVTRLLLSGYLRLRTPLYYKYCALLADEDHDVREPAEYYVTTSLSVDSIYFYFVDCLYYYNSENSEYISFDARQLIYDVMLQRLPLVQRLNAKCRLAREILQAAANSVDEGEELSQSMKNTLLDTITVLCGPRMKLPPRKQAPASTEITDMKDLQERVTKYIISYKTTLMIAEEVFPTVLRLHAGLCSGGGQLLTYIVRLATELFNEFHFEIQDLVHSDMKLFQQIEQFQATIRLEPEKTNARNLVTSSAPPEPETPRATRRRAASPAPSDREKLQRSLRM